MGPWPPCPPGGSAPAQAHRGRCEGQVRTTTDVEVVCRVAAARLIHRAGGQRMVAPFAGWLLTKVELYDFLQKRMTVEP